MCYKRNMTPQEVLLRAAELLETTGLAQGSLARTNSWAPCLEDNPAAACFCTLGALAKVSGKLTDDVFSRAEACDLLTKVISDNSIASWNDRLGRTKEEVIAKLREAAAL